MEGHGHESLFGLQLPGPSELDIFVLITFKSFFLHGLVTSKLLHVHNIPQRRVLLAGGAHKSWGYPEYLRTSSSPRAESHPMAPQSLQQIAKALLQSVKGSAEKPWIFTSSLI